MRVQSSEQSLDEANLTLSIPEIEHAPASELGTEKAAWLAALKWAFSFPVMLGTALAGAVFYYGQRFVVDPDVWWHVKTGQMILATHHWPTTDPYSFTVHGQPWMAYEWGGEVLIGWVSRIGGVRALDFLLIALGAAVVIALYALGTLRSGKSKAGFVAAAVLLPLALPSFTLRPQMLGYFFLVLTLIALELFRQGKQWAAWLLPLLMLAWVNTHGSFIVGLGAIFLYWICGLMEFQKGGVEAKRWSTKERRSLSAIFLLCLAVLPITPYGARLAAYPFNMAFAQPLNVSSIQEWQSMPFQAVWGKLFLAIALGFFLLQIVLHFRWRIEELLLFVAGVVMACVHERFILLFVPFTVPLVAVIAARWLRSYDREKDKYILNAVLIAGIAAAMVHYFPTRRALDEKVAEKFPAHAVEYLRQHPIPGPMLNNYGFGGYLIDSGYKTFIDGRGDLFERGGVFADYMRLTWLKPGGLDVLRRYQIQSCLIERDEPLATVLLASPDWRRVYVDNVSALFVRTDLSQKAGMVGTASPVESR
ncbi:MAG TPA: hypothetical protein VMF66_09350 [Candidatus Acidoferrum sp.]|nr:hypothetical protein [Candidatus Acidoferrum sp.]